jgi:arabinofuranan 3-O-arabinosyltransferase
MMTATAVATGAAGGPGDDPFSPSRTLAPAFEHLLLALVALVPLLLVDRGVTTSDTKSYLYLDPSRFLEQVSSLWLPTVALGTVTHQYVGYLFPMGPYFAATAALHVPTWIAQRVWMAGILFAAGAGILFVTKHLAAPLRGPGRLVAALAYMLSPYVLQYAARISVILLPWAGLPWLVGLAALALRRGREPGTGRQATVQGRGGAVPFPTTDTPRRGRGWRVRRWRHAALFALVLAAVSGINASSVLYVVVAPCLWLLWAVAVERQATWREALATLGQLALLSVLACAWWITGLYVEAAYGVDVLRYTESVGATSSTSTPLEVLRGLGYWYFYGGGRLGPWTQSVVLYTKWLWLVALSFLLPAVAFASGVAVRWRHRGYFVALVVVGVVLSVGAYPFTHPTIAGGALKAFMTDTTAGLAMRSTDRATPLVVLGLAVLLGAGADALWRSREKLGWTAGALVCAMTVANNPALFNGDMAVVDPLTQPSTLPGYDVAALHALNRSAGGATPATRVLAVPGDAFAAYTWGDTNDTPQPALLDRPFVTREQQVMGSMATADVLYATDAPIQTSIGDLSALAPMARLMSAGSLVVEYDQDSALYGSPQAVTLAERLRTTPEGLVHERGYGQPGQRVAKPTVDPELLAGTPHATKPQPLVTYSVTHPRPLARAESDTGALIVAGDAAGLETLAGQGLLDTTSAVYYAGTLDAHPARLRSLASAGATLVLTDSNRKQGFRWNGLAANAGQVETAGSDGTTTTPSESPIDLFPASTGTRSAGPSGASTVAAYVGATDVTASSYGNTVTYDPEARPYSAVDGNLRTAWETGTFVSNVDGQWWQVAFGHQVRADHVTLVQPLYGTLRRHITKVTLTFTGRDPRTVRLGAASLRRAGQRVRFAPRSFRTLRVTIDSTSEQKGTPVGFAEVKVPGQHVEELLELPTDLLHALGSSSRRDRLIVAMTRWRVSPYTTARTDPETTLVRAFTLPTARAFRVSGTATLSPLLSDDQIDRLVGVPGSTGSGVVAFSSSRLTGDLAGGAGAAAGGDGTVPWQSGFGAKDDVGAWLQYDLPDPVTFDHLTLRVVADRRHSVPAAIEVRVTTSAAHTTETRRVRLPLVLRSVDAGSTKELHLRFGAVTGNRVRIIVTKVLEKRGALADGTRTEYLPLGVASAGIPGVRVPRPPAALPPTCRGNLLRVDGKPVTVEVAGTTAAALDDGQVSVVPCGKDARGLRLTAGHHVVETTLATTPRGTGVTCTARRACDGWNIDELTLDSSPGGAASPGTVRPAPGRAPSVRARQASPTSWTLRVSRVSGHFELVLGESLDAGWHAVATPGPGARRGARPVTLGAPQLVDGFANGWQVTAAELSALGARGTAGFTVALTWAPQRIEWAGIGVSASALAACLVLGLLPARRRGRRPSRAAPHAPLGGSTGSGGRPAGVRARLLSALVRDGPGPAAVAAEPDVAGVARGPARRHRVWVPAVAGLVCGAAAAAISRPLAGPGVLLAVWLALAVPRLRRLPGAVAVACLLGAGALVVVGQAVHPAAGGGNWPGAYADPATLAAVAVAFLGADAVVGAVACGRSGPGRRRG